MSDPLKIGRKHTTTEPVTERNVASAYGNVGVHVFGTPAMITLIENTCGQCVQPTLSAGAGTVGTQLTVRHLAATPLGMSVTCSAEIIEIDRRRIVFAVEVHDDIEKIGTGTHERFIIPDIDKFLTKAASKTVSDDR